MTTCSEYGSSVQKDARFCPPAAAKCRRDRVSAPPATALSRAAHSSAPNVAKLLWELRGRRANNARLWAKASDLVVARFAGRDVPAGSESVLDA